MPFLLYISGLDLWFLKVLLLPHAAHCISFLFFSFLAFPCAMQPGVFQHFADLPAAAQVPGDRRVVLTMCTADL